MEIVRWCYAYQQAPETALKFDTAAKEKVKTQTRNTHESEKNNQKIK